MPVINDLKAIHYLGIQISVSVGSNGFLLSLPNHRDYQSIHSGPSSRNLLQTKAENRQKNRKPEINVWTIMVFWNMSLRWVPPVYSSISWTEIITQSPIFLLCIHLSPSPNYHFHHMTVIEFVKTKFWGNIKWESFKMKHDCFL